MRKLVKRLSARLASWAELTMKLIALLALIPPFSLGVAAGHFWAGLCGGFTLGATWTPKR